MSKNRKPKFSTTKTEYRLLGENESLEIGDYYLWQGKVFQLVEYDLYGDKTYEFVGDKVGILVAWGIR